MYCGIEEKRMLVVKGALFSSNYFNYKKKRKRRQKLHNLVSKSWQTMEGSSAIYTTLTLGSVQLYMTSFSSNFKYTCDESFSIRKLGNYSPMVFQWRKNKVKWYFLFLFIALSGTFINIIQDVHGIRCDNYCFSVWW